MIKNTRAIGTGFVLAIALAMLATPARAQSANENAIIQLNQKAMKAFRKGKVGVAMKRLNKALQMCTQGSIKGRALTTTYLHFGVVEADGNQNNSVAMDYFKQALCENPKVSLKGITAEPETKMLFKLVKKQVKKPGQCPGSGGAQTATAPPVRSVPLPAGTITQTDLIFHQSVVEQRGLTPVPIYVEVNPSYPIGEVILYYRTMGERIFQQVPMKQHGKGRAATIGCDVMQTFNPSGIEYYIGVLDHASQLLGTSGTEAQPHMVTIVQQLSGPPPALPDSEPPSGCAAECPPWDAACNQGCKQQGTMCDSSRECCPGMVCLDEMCTPSDDDYSGDDSDAILRIGLTFGGGAGLLPGKTVSPYNQTSATPQVAMDDAVANGGVVNTGALVTGTGIALNKFNLRLSAMYYVTPKFLIGASFRGGLALDNSGASEVMTIAPTILANVAFQITESDSEKFEMTALMGLGGGVIQYRVPYRDCNEYIINDPNNPAFDPVDSHPWYDSDQWDQYQTACHRLALDTEDRWAETGGGEWYGTNAWDGYTDWIEKSYFRKAGNLVVELGIDMNFWFVKGVGLNIGLISDVYFVPDFALNLDLQLGPIVRF